MTEHELEQAFDMIARGIDRAGRDRETVFLARLSLLLAHRNGDVDALQAAIEAALQEPAS